mmetsp:Transcript_2474/g.5379  ORF Transcript_2474/g.5379 Transcript_2474/m.5379 type:complete len:356 (+) Transcript_2474:185-1252(+)
MGGACSRRARPLDFPNGYPEDQDDDAVELKGDWCKENCIELCKEGEESIFRGKVQVLAGVRTTWSAIQALNAGWLSCDEGYCVLHSESSGLYYLLYTDTGKEAALGSLGLQPDFFDLQWLSTQEALAARIGHATVVINKEPGESFGLRLAGSKDSGDIKVAGITGGLVEKWNESTPDLAVQPGDVIVKVNGVAGDTAKMVEQLKKESGSFVLVIHRPNGGFASLENKEAKAKAPVEEEQPSAEVAAASSGNGFERSRHDEVVSRRRPAGTEFEVCMDKSGGEALGLKLTKDQEQNLVVASVNEGGLASQWNEMCPDRAIMAGDIILEANGVAGDALQIAQECKTSEVVNMVLCRP